MSVGDLTSLLGAIATVITAAAGFVAAWRQKRGN